MHTQTTRRGFLVAGGLGSVGAALAGTTSTEGAAGPANWSAAEQANVKTVRAFLGAWETKDATKMKALLTADAKARTGAHLPAPPAGPDALVEMAAKFFATSGVTFKILETVVHGPLVVNHRVDRIIVKAGQQDLHYMGVFFLKDGKIAEWSDYEVAPATPVVPGQAL